MCGAALDLAPDQALEAITTMLMNFQMPGVGNPNFRRYGALMAKHGIYDMRQHLDELIMLVLRIWKVFERNDFTARGEQTREQLGEFLATYEQNTLEFEERRDHIVARKSTKSGPPALSY